MGAGSVEPCYDDRRCRSCARPGCELYYEVTGTGPRWSSRTASAGITSPGGSRCRICAPATPASRSPTVASVRRARGPGGPGPRAFVDDLAALLDHLGLAEVRLVAQSMGGWTCLGYALREPERVRRW